jgi:hypothetical protein
MHQKVKTVKEMVPVRQAGVHVDKRSIAPLMVEGSTYHLL